MTARPSIALACCTVLLGLGLQSARAQQARGVGPLDVKPEPVWTHSSPIGELRYTPGRGVVLGKTGLHLGGYANVVLERDEGDPAELSPEDLSLFALWQIAPRLRVFSELEVENAFRIDDEGHVDSPDDRFSVERLYGDVDVVDQLTVRGGVFLTPVGRWNLVHAAPLVWTTSRPLTTKRLFDTRSTGAMAYGAFFPEVGRLSYSIYAQLADPIEGNPTFVPADRAFGGRLTWEPTPRWSIGASMQSAKRPGGWRHLGGLDFLWAHDRFELQGEAVVQDGGERPTAWGGYIQAAVGITPRFFFVERLEHFAPPGAPEVNLIASGVLFRVLSNAVLKLEYLAADTSSPNADQGFKTSAAILF